jgi:hypothetical protein
MSKGVDALNFSGPRSALAFASYESLRSRGMPIGKHIPDAGYFQEPHEFRATLELTTGSERAQLAFTMTEPNTHQH